MRIEILHIEECPNWVEAGARVEAALVELGRAGVEVTYRLLQSSEDAADVAFAGSPTILLDGVDAFPTDGQTSELACRVYWTESGPAGLPTVAQLVEVMRARTRDVRVDVVGAKPPIACASRSQRESRFGRRLGGG